MQPAPLYYKITFSAAAGEGDGSASDAGAAAGNRAAGEPGGKVPPASEAAKPRPADRTFVGAPLPQDRGEIGLGSFVLAYESPDEGWREAEVIGINGPIFSLRWRDYPTRPSRRSSTRSAPRPIRPTSA